MHVHYTPMQSICIDTECIYTTMKCMDTKSKIQNPNFWNINFTNLQNFPNSKFWFWWVTIDLAYFGTPKTSLFLCTTPESCHCRLFHASNGPWPWKSFLELWRSYCDLGQKVYRCTFLITFDELSNAVCLSFLALLVTKIADEGARFGTFWDLSAVLGSKICQNCILKTDSERQLKNTTSYRMPKLVIWFWHFSTWPSGQCGFRMSGREMRGLLTDWYPVIAEWPDGK